MIVSRGQLVEIGGSFRLPEIFEVSGARLREVGTTNRTRLADYERAIGPETAALLRVHPSNYRVVGFTESVAIADLAALAQDAGLLAIDDIGSGALGAGPAARRRRRADRRRGARRRGRTSCSVSGDKLLGGPQCGLIVGTPRGRRPARVRPADAGLPGRQDDAGALEATLRLALDPATGRVPNPALGLPRRGPPGPPRPRREPWPARFRDEAGLNAEAVESTAYLGGGSTPGGGDADASRSPWRPPFPDPWGVGRGLGRAPRSAPPRSSRGSGGGRSSSTSGRSTRPEDADLFDAVHPPQPRRAGTRSRRRGCPAT